MRSWLGSLRPAHLILALWFLLLAPAGAQTLAVLTEQGHVVFVDAAALRVKTTVSDTNARVVAGRRGAMAINSGEQGVDIFNLPSGTRATSFQSPYFERPVGLAFTEQQSLLVLSAASKTLVEMALADGQVRRVLPLSGPEPTGLYLQAGRLLITHQAGRLTEVDLASWKPLRQDTFLDPLGVAVFTTDRLLFTVPSTGSVRVLERETREPYTNLQPGPGVSDLVITDDGQVAAVLNEATNEVMAFQPGDGTPVFSQATGLKPKAATFSPDGKWLYVVNSGSGDLGVIDIEQARELGRLPLPGPPRQIVYIP